MKKIISLLLLSVHLTIFSAEGGRRGIKRAFYLSPEESIIEKEIQPTKKKQRIRTFFDFLSRIIEKNRFLTKEKLQNFETFLNKFSSYHNENISFIYLDDEFQYDDRITRWDINPIRTYQYGGVSERLKAAIVLATDSVIAQSAIIHGHSFPYALDYFSKFKSYPTITVKGKAGYLFPGSISKGKTSLYGFYTWATADNGIYYHRSMKFLKYEDPHQNLIFENINNDPNESLESLDKKSEYYFRKKENEYKSQIKTIIFCERDKSIAFETDLAIYSFKQPLNEFDYIYEGFIFTLYKKEPPIRSLVPSSFLRRKKKEQERIRAKILRKKALAEKTKKDLVN